MLLRQVEGFVEVARTGNVTRAAGALSLTQPALTARLRGLERELGVKLFVRSGRGVHLTEAGRAFLPHAERVLQTLAEARGSMEELGRGRAGKLTLGAAPAVSTYVLPAVLKRFHETHPRVRLKVLTGHSEEVLEMVLREEVELGLVRELRHPGVQSLPLYEDELVLVVHPEHRFGRRGQIHVEDIGAEQLIMFDRTSSYHDQTSAFFREAGVVLRDVMELDNIDAAKKMVQQGLGVALLPRTAVAGELAARTLRRVGFVGAPPLRRRIVAVRRRDAGEPSVIVSDFLHAFALTTDGKRRP